MTRLLMFLLLVVMLPSVSYAQSTGTINCPEENLARSQLVSGIKAEVVSPRPIELYSDPSTDTELVAQLPTGTLVFITSGPQCEGEHIWWQVQFDLESTEGTRDFGWVKEFVDSDRQLNPLIPTLNLPRIITQISPSNLSQLQPLAEMEPLGDVQQLVWSPNSSYLAISTLWAVWVYNTSEPYAVPRRLPPTAGSFWNQMGSIVFSQDEQMIATVGLQNGDLHLWSLTSSEEQVIETHATDYAGVAAIASDFSKWVISHWDGSISVWDSQTGTRILTLTGHTVVGGLAFTPDGSLLLSRGELPLTSESASDNTLRLWDMETGHELSVLEIPPPPSLVGGPEARIAVNTDGTIAVVFSYLEQQGDNYPSATYVIDIPAASISNQFTLVGNGSARGADFSPNDNILAVNFAAAIVFLDPTDGTELARLPFEQIVQEVAFSPDGRWLAVAHESNSFFNRSNIQFWGIL